MSISIAEALRQAGKALLAAGVPDGRKEAASLLADVIQRDRTFLISHSEELLSSKQLSRFHQFISRRTAGEPLQYITGVQDFFGRSFRVTPDVLIPRPETELLVEAALELIRARENAFICDVGTGSGCIAISLACELRNLRAIAVDLSAPALEVARSNAITHRVDQQIEFRQSDCFTAIKPDEKFDLVVSNPPYVAANAVSGLQREVKDHEPLIALSPGGDGLAVIKQLLTESLDLLKERGHLLIEIGFDQSEAVSNLLDPCAWKLLQILPDLQGIPRIVSVQRVN